MKKLLLFVLLFFSFNLHAEVINVETKGNLKSENPLACVDITTQDISKHTPADILIGSKKCIDKKDYSNAARLYKSAAFYGRFDIARVKDKTAHQGMRVLYLKFSQSLSKEQLLLLQPLLLKQSNTTNKVVIADDKTICKHLIKPNYYPNYLIMHGIQAINGAKSGLIKSFKPAIAWTNIRVKYMKCADSKSDPKKEQASSQLLDLEKKCDRNDFASCFNLGVMYKNGTGTTKSLEKSITLFTKACEGKDSDACYNLGHAYLQGNGVKIDYKKAYKYFKKNCKVDVDGCIAIGSLIEKGQGLEKNEKEAKRIYESICYESKNTVACHNLAAIYTNSDTFKDTSKAIKIFKENCKNNYSKSCFNAGVYYLKGIDPVKKDPLQALEFFDKACDNNYAQACFNAGVVVGITKKHKGKIYDASHLYQKSCDLGFWPACNNLGNAFMYGRGVSKDFGKARALFQKGCNNSVPDSCFSLAQIYALGKGAKKNLPLSYKLYERACSLNSSTACSFLTRVHKAGCDNGSKKACDNLKELEVKQSVSKRITTEKKKITKSKGLGKEDIDRACLNQNKPPKDGMQFDGKKADAKIMQLKAGKYKYNGGHLLLFRNNHYILQLPKDRDGVNGTDGPDLLASGIVGGCAKEQLSEAIQNNNLKGRSFKLIKRYIK